MVDEISIFGISLSLGTIANLLVALATFLLAFFTWRLGRFTLKHVKTSERQIELLQKEKESRQALEQIRILNPIQDDLTREIEILNNYGLLWGDFAEAGTSHLGPLIFPVVYEEKKFYDDFKHHFFCQPLISNNKIPQFIDQIDQNLRERRPIYLLLSSEVQDLVDEIEKNYRSYFEELISEASHFSSTTSTIEISDKGGNSRANFMYSLSQIPAEKLINLMKSMIISQLFNPVSLGDYRIWGLGYSKVMPNLIPYIQGLLERIPVQKIFEIKFAIDKNLEKLKNIDENSLENIKNIKLSYRDTYTFTENDIDPPEKW